jgi:hypothetical protein
MIGKALKLGALVVGGGLTLGLVAFGADYASYLRTSARSVRGVIHENVPVEFELRRAHDLLDQIGPEVHDHVRAIAEQEVAVATLKRDITEGQVALVEERQHVKRLRDAVASSQVSFTFGDLTYSRTQLIQELGRRFTHMKEAEVALATKQQLLESRQKSFVAAEEALESAKAQKATLEAQIEGLEAQYQLLQAASTASSSPAAFDHSKLAQAKRAVEDIRRELAVSERVLAHEAKFTQPLPTGAINAIDAVDDKDLVMQVDAHLSGKVDKSAKPAVTASAAPIAPPAPAAPVAPAAPAAPAEPTASGE